MAFKKDLQAPLTELPFGATLRVPREFFAMHNHLLDNPPSFPDQTSRGLQTRYAAEA